MGYEDNRITFKSGWGESLPPFVVHAANVLVNDYVTVLMNKHKFHDAASV